LKPRAAERWEETYPDDRREAAAPDEESEMPRNEDGEFELILGNKQLLTVFFIVVVLLGIFATMGYIVGRSTVPAPAETAKKEAQDHPTRVVDPTKPEEAASAETAKTPALGPGEIAVGGSPAVPAAKPVTESKPVASPAAAPAMEKQQETAKPAPKTEAAKPVAASKAPPSGAMFIEPAMGQMFLQVAAVGKPDAEILVGILRKNSFAGVMAAGPSEKEKLYRVLVGPLKDPTAVSKTRADLEAAGFKGSILRKY
jgi:cell division septation protein DedD